MKIDELMNELQLEIEHSKSSVFGRKKIDTALVAEILEDMRGALGETVSLVLPTARGRAAGRCSWATRTSICHRATAVSLGAHIGGLLSDSRSPTVKR